MDSVFKTRYKNRIKEVMDSLDSSSLVQEDTMENVISEMEEEISLLKKEKKEKLNHYAKILKYYVLFADIFLLVGVGLLFLGIYMKTYVDVKVVFPALILTLAAFFMVGAGVLFGLAEYNREQRHTYFKNMVSDADISSLMKIGKEAKEEYKIKYEERMKGNVTL